MRSGWAGIGAKVLWGAAAFHLMEAVVLRYRRGFVRSLGERLDAADARSSAPATGEVHTLLVAGATIGSETVEAVAHAMRARGPKVIDLVPGDIGPERTLRLLRRVAVDQLARDPLYAPGGAHDAVAVDGDVARKLALNGHACFERGEIAALTVRAQLYARGARELCLAPDLRAAPYGAQDRWREIVQANDYTMPYVSMAPTVVGAETLHLAALSAGFFLAPAAALATLAAWSAKPVLVLGGRARGRAQPEGGPRPPAAIGLTPSGWLRAGVLRLPMAWLDNLGLVATAIRASRANAAQRRVTSVEESPPLDKLFEERRDDCPWCGADTLTGVIDSLDVVQHKPGEFHLDRCDECGHVFQNPRLTLAGLDYYYDQVYEGLGEGVNEAILGGHLKPKHEHRIATMARFHQPSKWLDVGMGLGHCVARAKQRWPEATFHGNDMSSTVEEAQRRGYIERAFRGFFPGLVDQMPHDYDVVSMYHYLEHTPEPRRELAAVDEVLTPGGYVQIEVPDPESPWARRLGRWHYEWGQPQHLHFIPCNNLVAELESMGFEIVAVERASATLGGDLVCALVVASSHFAPSSHFPWLPPPSLPQRLLRMAVVAVSTPLCFVAYAIDLVKDARPGPDDIGNAYRVTARKRT